MITPIRHEFQDMRIFIGNFPTTARSMEKDGWELIAVCNCSYTAGMINLFFKRPENEKSS